MKRVLPILIQAPLVLLAGGLLALLLQGAMTRLFYPFDMEWMEGGMLVHAWRLREGLGLYTEPDADWIPYIYPPLYPWVMAVLGEPSYTIGRGLSLVGALAAAAAAAFAVHREGAPWGLAVAAAGLFIGCYDESGTFYDLVRADAFALGFAAWSFVLCRIGTRRAVLGSAALLVLAFLAKHNYALFGVPMVIWLLVAHGRRRALEFAAASMIPALLATAAIQIASGGHYLTYLLEVPGSHPLVGERAWPKSEIELATSHLWTNVAMVGLGLVWVVRRRFDRRGLYWLLMVSVAVGLCILMRAHHGGYINVLMPGHWALAVAGMAMLGAAVRRWPHPVVLAAACAVTGWQLWEARWDNSKMIPTEADVAAGEEVVDTMREIDGEVFAPHFPWYPAMAGKTPSLPLIALWDIDHKGGPYKKYAKRVDEALAAQRWAAVVTPDRHTKHGLEDHYEKGERLRFTGRTFQTKTGWRVKPTTVWLPQDRANEAALEPDPELIVPAAEGPGPDEVEVDPSGPVPGI